MNGNEYQHRSSWKEDARTSPRKKVIPPKSKACPKCGTFAHRKIGEPCPYCFYLSSDEQRQYIAHRNWCHKKQQERREDAELDRILER